MKRSAEILYFFVKYATLLFVVDSLSIVSKQKMCHLSGRWLSCVKMSVSRFVLRCFGMLGG